MAIMAIADVTYKEVMQFWNMNKYQAVYRLNAIRKKLEKQRRQRLTVVQFCKTEGITEEEFFNKLNPKP